MIFKEYFLNNILGKFRKNYRLRKGPKKGYFENNS